MHDVATFEFCVRRLSARRNFLMAAGLVLDYLCGLGFLDTQLAELDNTDLSKGLAHEGGEHQGLCVDSGHPGVRARRVRHILDAGGRDPAYEIYDTEAAAREAMSIFFTSPRAGQAPSSA